MSPTPDDPALVEIVFLPREDNSGRASRARNALDLDRDRARMLGEETLTILEEGRYTAPSGTTVEIGSSLAAARKATISYGPDTALASSSPSVHPRMTVSVRNETTLEAAQALLVAGRRPLALNFAAAGTPGGGFTSGARAQEETLARSSGLYACIEGDPMYTHHRRHGSPMGTSWAILSPDVPVFRRDDGTILEQPYLCSIITCAAPHAKVLLNREGQSVLPRIEAALRERIDRVLAIARAHAFDGLVLGAWGCGAFGNDPYTVALLFREALRGRFRGAFAEIVFAITDWSPERKFLGPFARVFAPGRS